MRNRTKGAVAAAAGAALLVGGGTFALWSDSADVAGGTITNGTLDVTASAITWTDVSPDRADSPHAITDLTTWRMVPGDVVEGTTEVEVTLVGDNLVAELGVTTVDAAALPEGIEVSYAYTVEGDGSTAVTGVLGEDSPVRFAANRTGQDAGDPENAAPTVVVGEDGTVTLTLAVTVTFDGSVTGTTSAEAETVLGALNPTLTQVRTGADFTPSAAPTVGP